MQTVINKPCKRSNKLIYSMNIAYVEQELFGWTTAARRSLECSLLIHCLLNWISSTLHKISIQYATLFNVPYFSRITFARSFFKPSESWKEVKCRSLFELRSASFGWCRGAFGPRPSPRLAAGTLVKKRQFQPFRARLGPLCARNSQSTFSL